MNLAAATRMSLPLMLLAAAGAAVIAGTLTLWGYYGTAIFFEMVRAGWIACF